MRIHHHSRTFSFDRADLLKNQLGKVGFDRKGSEQKSVCVRVGGGEEFEAIESDFSPEPSTSRAQYEGVVIFVG